MLACQRIRVVVHMPRWLTGFIAGLVFAVPSPFFGEDKLDGTQPDLQALEQAIVQAASITSKDLGEILETGSASRKTLPLTAVFFVLRPTSPRETKDFGFETTIKSKAFIRSFDRLRTDPENPRVSAINPQHIRKLLCVLNNGEGQGQVELGVDQVWHARVAFSCKFAKGLWIITEFQLPTYQVRVVLESDGSWKLVDPRGLTGLKGRPGASKEFMEMLKGEE